MNKISRLLVPSISGVIVYIIVRKFFPEKAVNTNSQKDLRGGDVVKTALMTKIIKKILEDRAIKLCLITVFATAGMYHFHDEVAELLADKVFTEICVKDGTGKLKLFSDIIKEHEIHLHSKAMSELIARNNLSTEQKIDLLKIKLDFLINGEFAGKKRFLVITLIAILVTVSFSGVAGLGLFLEALYRLFQEGKISRAVYEELLKSIAKRWTGNKVSVEHLY